MKRCSKCGETKPRSEFNKDKGRKDGLQSYCKECKRADDRERRTKLATRSNEELEAARSKVSELKCNKCKQVQSTSEFRFNRTTVNGYYPQCRSCSIEYYREWRENNPGYNSEYNREYYREYYKQNADHKREQQRNWNQSNPEKRRSYSHARRIRKRGTLSEWSLKQSAAWRRVISEMPCYYCGTNDPWIVYHVDHRIPVSKGGDDSWVNLVRSCEPCNLSKSAKTDAEFFGWI